MSNIITGIISFLYNNLGYVVSVVITLLGIIGSNINLRKTYKNEINKIRTEKIYEITEGMPLEIIDIMKDIVKNKRNMSKNVDNLSKFWNKLIAYGSPDAVKIGCYIQQSAYNKENNEKLLAAYSLLITQLKFDLTNQITSPESYFLINITDYKKTRDKQIKNLIEIIDQLNLNKEFKKIIKK